jgi:hypothetical protein
VGGKREEGEGGGRRWDGLEDGEIFSELDEMEGRLTMA